jgi:hypothetical protein
MQTTITTRLGVQCECYGALEDDSNFEVVCDDEEHDFVWLVGNTNTGKPFKTWQEAADFLEDYAKDYTDGLIVEISAV